MGAARFAKSIAVVVVSMAAAQCTPEAICPAIGCTSGATIDASFPLPPSTFDGATFTLCVNDVCSSGVLAPVDGGLQMSDPQNVVLTGALYDQSVAVTVHGGGTDVEFDFVSRVTTLVHDGDSYEVKIVGSDGTTILDATRAVTYTTPDEKCSPACRDATIKVTS